MKASIFRFNYVLASGLLFISLGGFCVGYGFYDIPNIILHIGIGIILWFLGMLITLLNVKCIL